MGKWIWCAGIVAMLAGCATPPGQLKHNELVWASYDIAKPISQVYEGLESNARYCGGLIDEYVPRWYPSTNMESAKIDLFLKGLGGTSDHAAGMIELKKTADGATMKVGIQKVYSNPVFRAKDWWKPRVTHIAREIETGAKPSCS